MPCITLNQREIALLKSAIRRGDDDPGFQKLLVTLDQQLKDRSGQIDIPQGTLELIQYYGCGGGRLSWHATLFSILGRTMGETFSQQSGRHGHLIDIRKTPQQLPESDQKGHRVA